SILSSFASICFVSHINEFLRDIEFRKQYIAGKFIGFTFVEDFTDIENCFGQIRKNLLHLLIDFQVKLIVWKSKPEFSSTLADVSFRFLFVLTIFYTKKDVVRNRIFFMGVIGIVGGNILDIVFFTELQQRVIHHLFF